MRVLIVGLAITALNLVGSTITYCYAQTENLILNHYTSPSPQVVHLVDTAQTYVHQRRWAEAEEVLDQAIAQEHQSVDAHLLRAQVREQRYDLLGAITDYTSVIYLQAGHYEARFQRGLALMEVERYPAARADFLYLLDNPPAETNSVYYRSDPQSTSSGVTGITTLQSVMRPEWLNAVGLTYYHQENYTQAQRYFCQAVAEDASNAHSYVNLGLTAERQTDTIAAINYYQQALAVEPTHATALHNLAALARLRHDPTLLADIERNSEKESYESLMHQGLICIDQTEYEEAVSYFTRALKQSENHDAYLQRGYAHEKLGRLDDALSDYSAAIQHNPITEKAYANRGNVYVKTENYSLAVADYSRAIELNPQNARTFYNRGIAYHRLRQIDRACEDWQRANALGETASAAPLTKVCKD